MLRRALTDDERSILQRRAAELENGLTPGTAQQRDDVRAALHAMRGGRQAFHRESGDGADAAVDVTLYVLKEFPAWAIEQACLRIAQGCAGIELHPRAMPSDEQIFDVVSGIVAPYRKVQQQAKSLLAAPVEPPEPPRPPRAEIEAKLGRTVGDGTRVHPIGPKPDEQPYDGKHAQRVAAELAARRQRREAAGEGAA